MAEGRKGGGEPRLERADWELAALAAIEVGGLDDVAVEPLARTLGVTKGSFYWHFRSRDELLAAALARWESQYTEGVIAVLEKIADPRDRLRRLVTEAFQSDRAPRMYVALSAGAEHPVVRRVFMRVTNRRLDYLQACFRALGLRGQAARQHALLAYSAYVGLMHLQREAPRELPAGRARLSYVQHLSDALLPAEGVRGRQRSTARSSKATVGTE